MPNILITSREIFSQLSNGESFSLNLSDFATHLKGSAMEKLKVIYEVDVSWDSQATSTNRFSVGDGGAGAGNQVDRETGSFIIDGFSVGDTFDMLGDIVALGRTVVNISSDGKSLFFDGGALGQLTTITLQLRGLTELTGFDFRFGLLGNDEVFNFESKVDGSDQIYTAAGVGNDPGGGRITTFIDAESKGQIKGWQSGSVKVRFVSTPSTYVQRFELEHIFLILPFYLEGEFQDLENNIQPDRFKDDNTLKYAVQLQFRDVISNPNTAKTGIDDFLLGSVGGFDQNFNGFNEKYSITSITYEEISTTNSSDGIIVGSATKVTVVVASEDSTFVAGVSIFGVYHSFLPPDSTYTDNTDVFQDIWLYDNKIQTLGSAPVSSTIITAVEGTFDSAAQITIEFEVAFTVAQQALIDSEDNYVIGIQVADTSLSTDDSDKLILKAASRNYIKSADVPGLVEIQSLEFFPHPADVVGSGFTDCKGWLEDGYVAKFRIFTDLNKDAVIDSLKLRLVAFNSVTEDIFDLDSFNVDFTSTFVPDTPADIQQINVSTTRNFRLQPTDQFNQVIFATNNRIVDDQFFNGEIGFKIRWEEWILQADANPIFFDNTQDNDGLNKKTPNFSGSNGYAIHIVLEVGMLQVGLITDYEFFSPAFNIQTYDADDGAGEWTADIKTFTPLSSELIAPGGGPGILFDDFTTFQTIWNQVAGDVIDLADFVVILRIEERDSQGQQIEEFSSLASRAPADNPKLVASIGETRTKLTIVGGDIVSECRIDFNELDSGKQYDLSARLISLTNSPILPTGTKLKEDGDPKEKEDGDFKFVE